MQLDEDIIQQVLRMGFDRNQLLESLQTRIQNDVSSLTFYDLCFLCFNLVVYLTI